MFTNKTLIEKRIIPNAQKHIIDFNYLNPLLKQEKRSLIFTDKINMHEKEKHKYLQKRKQIYK